MQVIDLIKAILGADFSKLCLIVGLLLFLVAIIDGAFEIKKFKFPKINTIPRVFCGLMGAVLLLVPVAGWVFNITIGLIHFPEAKSYPTDFQKGTSFISQALAQEKEEVVERLRIEQRHKKILMGQEFSGKVTFYVDDVHLKEPTKVLVFKTGQETDRWKDKEKINYDDLKRYIKGEDMLLRAKVSQGGEASFVFNERVFILKTPRIVWHLFGKDYVEIEIYRRE